jgi:predicted outer membrane repeat protein
MLEALEQRWVPSMLTVTNNLDSGAGSLRAEIAAAHKNDTIVFDPSLDGQTITLTSGQLLINKNLTIAGPRAGGGQLTVSGNNASRVFEVAKGAKQVTLSNMTISNGFAADGAGIENYGGLTVSGSDLRTNSASGGGAGIYNHLIGTLTVSNTVLTLNTASNDGGGISNDGTATVTNCTLTSNSSTAYNGGAIANFGTMMVSDHCYLAANSANDGGGAIYAAGGTLTVGLSTLSGNSAFQGGAIYDGAGTLTVSGSYVSGNSAFQGGGIYNYHGVLTVSGSNLTLNVASTSGGGIYISPSSGGPGTVTVENSSSITGNTAPLGYGADVYNLGVLYLASTSIIGILDGNPAIPI